MSIQLKEATFNITILTCEDIISNKINEGKKKKRNKNKNRIVETAKLILQDSYRSKITDCFLILSLLYLN